MAIPSNNLDADLEQVGVIGDAPVDDLEDFGTVGNTPLTDEDHSLARISALNKLKANPLDPEANQVIATQKRLFGGGPIYSPTSSGQPVDNTIIPLAPEVSDKVSEHIQGQASEKNLGEYLTKADDLVKATEIQAAQELYDNYVLDPVAHPLTAPEVFKLTKILQDGRSWEKRFADEASQITLGGIKNAATKTWSDIRSSFEGDQDIKNLRENPLNIVNPAANARIVKNMGVGLIAGGARMIPSVTDLASQAAQATIGAGIGKVSPEAEQNIDAALNTGAGVIQAGFGDAATRLEKVTGAEGKFATGVGEQGAALFLVGGTGAGQAIEKISKAAPRVVEGAKAGIYKAASKAAPAAAKVAGTATKAGIGYGIGETVGHGTIGAIVGMLAKRGTHSISDAVGEIAKTKFEQLAADASVAARAKEGQSGVEAIRAVSLTGAKDAEATAAEYISKLDAEEVANLMKLKPSGEPMYNMESPGLSPKAKEVFKQQQIARDLKLKAEMLRGKIRSERMREWLLSKTVEVPLKAAEGAAVISGLGAAGAPVNQGAEAVEHGIPVGIGFGLTGAVAGVPGSLAENRLATNRAYLHDFARTNLTPKGLGIIESIPDGPSKDRILSQIGESMANGTKVSLLSPEEMSARYSTDNPIPPEQLPSGWYKDGEIVLNADNLKKSIGTNVEGVEGHEAFHPYFEEAKDEALKKRNAEITKRFSGPESISDAVAFTVFKRNYAEAVKAEDPEYFKSLTPEQLAEEAQAEAARLLSLSMPPEYFYGGRGVVGHISDWLNRAANFISPGRTETVPGFDAPVTPADMLSIKKARDEQGKSAKDVLEGKKPLPEYHQENPPTIPGPEAPKPEPAPAPEAPKEDIADFHGKLMPSLSDALVSPAVKTDEGIIVKGGSHFEAKKAAQDMGLKGAEVGFTARKTGFKSNKDDEALNHGIEIGQLPEDQTTLSDADFAENRKFMPQLPEEEKPTAGDKYRESNLADAIMRSAEPQKAGMLGRRVAAGMPMLMPSTINIGLDVKGGGRITPERAIEALNKLGVNVTNHAVHQSDTEPTLSAHLSRPLTPEEAHNLSQELNQEAIAQFHNGEGDLHGPGADKWKPFNPDYFITPNGEKLSDQKPITEGRKLEGAGPNYGESGSNIPREYGGSSSGPMTSYMPSTHPDAIDKPAMRRNSDGKVFAARNAAVHWMMPNEIPELGDRFTSGGVDRYDDGWVDKKGNFLTKKEAHERAVKIGQIEKGFKTEYKGALSSLDLGEGRKFMPSTHPNAIDRPAVKDGNGEILSLEKDSLHGEIRQAFDIKGGISGFIDRNKKFYDRREALEHAEKINQVTRMELSQAGEPYMKKGDLDPAEDLDALEFDIARKFMPQLPESPMGKAGVYSKNAEDRLPGIRAMKQEVLGGINAKAPDQYRDFANKEGLIYNGSMPEGEEPRLHLFSDPTTMSTISVKPGEELAPKLEESRAKFNQPKFMPSTHPDAIKEAAIKMGDGSIFTGSTHGDAWSKVYDAYQDGRDAMGNTDGFVTNSGEFLTRRKAETRAAEIGQLQHDSQEGLESIDFDRTKRFMPSTDPEALKKAAVRFPDGKIYEGWMHPAAWADGVANYSAEQLGRWMKEYGDDYAERGYIKNNGDFVNAIDAENAALEHGQVTEKGLKQARIDNNPKQRVLEGGRGLEALDFERARKFMPNYGAPKEGYVPWEPSEADYALSKARVGTSAGQWDAMTPEQRKVARPDWNPGKRWFEQQENKVTKENSKYMPATNELRDFISRIPVYKLDNPFHEEHGFTQYQTTTSTDRLLSKVRDKGAKFAKLDNPLVMIGSEYDMGLGWKETDAFLSQATKDGHDGIVILSPWAFPESVYKSYPKKTVPEERQRGVDFAHKNPAEVDWEHKDNVVIPLDESKISDQAGYSQDELLDKFNQGEITKEELADNLTPKFMPSTDLLRSPIPKKGGLGDAAIHRGVTIRPTGQSGPLYVDLQRALDRWTKAGGKKDASLEASISDAIDEVRHQLQNEGGKGLGWYGEDIKKTLDAVSEVIPSIKDDPTKQGLFKFVTAALSYGKDPGANLDEAVHAFRGYENTGKLPLDRGDRGYSGYAGSVFSLRKIQDLIDKKGEQGALDWLMTKHPISEVKEEFKSVSSSTIRGKKDELVYGAMAFGPKGGPFSLNLNGINDHTTVDIWGARALRRWRGNLSSYITEGMPGMKGKGGMTTDSPPTTQEHKDFHHVTIEASKKLGVTPEDVQALLWFYEHELYRVHGVGDKALSYSDFASKVVEKYKVDKKAKPAESDPF